MSRGRWGLAALTVVLVACQGAPPPARQAVKDDVALAAEALERGDYARAADLYRAALAGAPDSLPSHYGLGVAASHLERRGEAVREFSWVVKHGEATSREAQAARRWLASVGALPRAAAPAASAEPDEAARPGEKPATASVQGRVVSGEAPNDVVPVQRMQLILMEYPSRVQYHRVRTDEQGRFRFANVVPGTYKLTDRAAGTPQWRLRVELKPGQDVTLDLGPGNTTRMRDDFPG